MCGPFAFSQASFRCLRVGDARAGRLRQGSGAGVLSTMVSRTSLTMAGSGGRLD
jgi:hypothetical protein